MILASDYAIRVSEAPRRPSDYAKNEKRGERINA